jgi:hypothetical protein
MSIDDDKEFDNLIDIEFDKCYFSCPCQHKITYLKNNIELKKLYHAPAILNMIIQYKYPVKYLELKHFMKQNYKIEIIYLFDKLKLNYESGTDNALIYESFMKN